jgi:hypothetical protein
MWLKPSSAPSSGLAAILDNDVQTGSGKTWFALHQNSSSGLDLAWNGATFITTVNTLPLNTWTYVAVVRTGTLISLYAAGARIGSFSVAAGDSFGGNTKLNIGEQLVYSRYYKGNIDELRITPGIARYSGASVTVPTTAFPNQ